MDCKHVDALLMDYLYQELDPGQAEHVEAHLQTCARCTGELSAYERTRATMRDLPALEPPAALDDLLLREAAKAVRLQPEPAPSFLQRMRESLRLLVLNPAMTAAVTLVVVLGISFVIYRNSPPPTSAPTFEQPMPPMAPVTAAAPEGEEHRGAATAVATPAATEKNEKNEQVVGTRAAKHAVAAGERESAARLRRQLARDEAEAPKLVPGFGRTGQSHLGNGLASTASPAKKMARSARRADKELALGDATTNRAPARESKSAGYADDRDALDAVIDGKAGGKGGGGGGAKRDEKLRPAAHKSPAPVVAAAEPRKPAGPPAAKPRPTVNPKAEPAVQSPTTVAKIGKTGELGKVAGGAPSTDAPLQENVTINKQSPQRYKKSSGVGALAGKDKAQAEEDQQPLRGKGKYGQSAGLKQSAGQAVATADFWIKQGLAAQKRNDCSHALAYYEHAMALNPKLQLDGKLAGLVRSCASTLNETALAEARKSNRHISGWLNVELARRAKMRQKAVDLESAQTSGKARAVKAKAAKPVNVDKAAH